jgi:hypothetical protein
MNIDAQVVGPVGMDPRAACPCAARQAADERTRFVRRLQARLIAAEEGIYEASARFYLDEAGGNVSQAKELHRTRLLLATIKSFLDSN